MKKEETKVENKEQLDKKVAEQKEIFESIAKSKGKKIKYNPEWFEQLDVIFTGILYSCAHAEFKEKMRKEYGRE